MKQRYPILILLAVVATGTLFFYYSQKKSLRQMLGKLDNQEDAFGEREEETFEKKAEYVEARRKYEFDLIKDPATGKVPARIFERELTLARSLPSKDYSTSSGIQGVENLNNYFAVGPDSIGGRTRALAIDKRFDNSTNRVIISGCVSGGILRSSDAGQNWTRVSPENDVHNVTAIAQDPRSGFENTWYAGGGEPIGNSASDDGASFFGFGIWKSTDNGITWTKLTRVYTNLDGTGQFGAGSLEGFDNAFDFVQVTAAGRLQGA